jgi:RNA-directed DNA polymerase
MQPQKNLMEELAAPENLLTAWRTVRGNIPRYRRQRSAGPDGVTLAEFERDLAVQLSSLRHALLKARYQPQRPGLFSVQKSSGGTRQIALLNVVDRVAQRAAQQVIEPLYEPDFLPCSFGFRPGRSVQDAVYCARRLRQSGYAWVVDGDIATCFDSLDHRLLIQRASHSIHDRRVLDLLEKWLSVGILESGTPAVQPNLVEQGLQKAAGGLRQGVNWALNTLVGSDQSYDPYAAARYESPAYRPEQPASAPDEEAADSEGFYRPPAEAWNQRAMQQIATGGLFMGAGWARRALLKAGPALATALKSPLGQQTLKRGLLAGGGAVGAAAGVVVMSYLVCRQVAPAPVGVLQGSPLSPLLANIYLHSFDLTLTRAGYRLVRFADDWVILCPDQQNAEMAFNQAIQSLNHIHLKVNREKTHILTPAERLEWLGEVVS